MQGPLGRAEFPRDGRLCLTARTTQPNQGLPRDTRQLASAKVHRITPKWHRKGKVCSPALPGHAQHRVSLPPPSCGTGTAALSTAAAGGTMPPTAGMGESEEFWKHPGANAAGERGVDSGQDVGQPRRE